MRYQPFTLSKFPGGRNSAGLPTTIKPDQLAEALNKEYNSEDHLVDRTGYSKINTDSISGRVTSIWQFRKTDGTEKIMLTNGQKVYTIDASTGVLTDITNSATFTNMPNDTLWQWVTFPVGQVGQSATVTEAAIGVNRGTDSATQPNPVYYEGSGNIKRLTDSESEFGGSDGAAPSGRFICIWNNRVFIVSESNPFRIYWSRPGNGADFVVDVNEPNTSGGFQDVGAKDGEAITGMYVHRQRLFIFKRTRIYMVIPGTPNTDSTLWKYETFSQNIGCIGQFTIQDVLNDLFFLSDYGVASLNAVDYYGDLDQALRSKDIKELREFNRNLDSYYSVVHPEKAQYRLAIPKGLGDALNSEVHVYDYKKGTGPDADRWTLHDGLAAGACYAKVRQAGRERVWVGGYGAIYREKLTTDTDPYSDNGGSYLKLFRTRELAPDGDPFLDKLWHRWGIGVKLFSDSLDIAVTVKFDGNDSKSNGGVSYSFDAGEIGSIWADDDSDTESNEFGSEGTFGNDSGSSGTCFFSTENPSDSDLVERFGQPEGRHGQTVEMTISNNVAGQAFALKHLFFEAAPTSNRHVGEV